MTDLTLAFWIYGLGIAISMLVALMIKGIVVLLALRRPPPAAIPAPAAVAQDREAIAAADIPVIAAAVFAALGTQRIVHIQDVSRGRAWTSTTRASHYASHNLPRRPRR